jgi:hypothetical protein
VSKLGISRMSLCVLVLGCANQVVKTVALTDLRPQRLCRRWSRAASQGYRCGWSPTISPFFLANEPFALCKDNPGCYCLSLKRHRSVGIQGGPRSDAMQSMKNAKEGAPSILLRSRLTMSPQQCEWARIKRFLGGTLFVTVRA